ncbi:MAG TPA: hypothetical protein VGK48_18965 [Terriglobia bacterium]|jgi:hypothetical protein
MSNMNEGDLIAHVKTINGALPLHAAFSNAPLNITGTGIDQAFVGYTDPRFSLSSTVGGQPDVSTVAVERKRRRSFRVPVLKAKTKDGRRYQRPPHVEAQNAEMLRLSESEWVARREGLENETLVFLILRTHRVNDTVCGVLTEELRERQDARVRRFTQQLDPVDEETVLMNVDTRVMQLLFTPTPGRKSAYLQARFAKEVGDLAIAEIKKLGNTPMGNIADFDERTDEDVKKPKRPIEFVPDDGPGPNDFLLKLDARNTRHQLLRIACENVPDRRALRATVLYFGHDIPITSTRRGQKCLTRMYRKPAHEIRYWIDSTLARMRAALGVETPASKRKKK